MSPSRHCLNAMVAGGALFACITAYSGPGASGTTYEARMAALRAGGQGVEDLKGLLLDSGHSAGMDAVQERAYLNEVMNALRRSAGAGDGIEGTLITLASDSGRDPGVREYALQHLGLWRRNSAAPTLIEDALWRFASDPMLSASAILQLHHLGGARLKGRETWATAVMQAISRENMRDADKTTLLLVAAESALVEALPKARDWALAAEDTALLKCAIHAVGTLGTPADLRFLDDLRSRKNLKDVDAVWAKSRERLKEGGAR